MSREGKDYSYRRSAPSSRRESYNPPAPPPPKPNSSRLDEKIQRLMTATLPKAPYLVSVPSDVPYQPPFRVVNTWHYGTPFALDEEALQYMSFIGQKIGDHTSLIKTVGGWSDEQGNLVDEDPSPSLVYGSASGSPTITSQRKKITLSDYKIKAKGGAGGESVKSDNTSQSSRRHSEAESLQRGREHEKMPKTEVAVGTRAEDGKERKRSFDLVADASSNTHSPKLEKRPRTRSPVRARSPKSPPRRNSAASTKVPRVPSLLSPTLPDSLMIPELLSPTLPSSIEDFLEQENAQENSNPAPTTHQRSDSVRSILSGTGLGLDISPMPVSKKAGMLRNNHERHLSPSLQLDLKDAKSSPGARSRDPTSSPGPKRRHVVVLKYGKRNKKRIEALLKFAPRNKRQAAKPVISRPALPSPRIPNGDKVVSPETVRGLPKRRTSFSTSEQPLKRPKVPPSLNLSDRPTTPTPAAFKSPGLQNPSLPRSAFSTPKKDLKNAAMRRVESSEGVDARTPVANLTRHNTPGSTDRTQPTVRQSSPSDSNLAPVTREDVRREWKALNVRYFELGRSIKHESQPILNRPDRANHKHGVLLAIEALQCFMLNQASLSSANNGQDPGWRTLLPYLGFVLRFAKPYPHLYGLASQLGAVVRQIIARYDFENVTREPLSEDLLEVVSAPTPGADGVTRSIEDVDRARRKWKTFLTDLADNTKELQRLWLDSYQKLGPDALKASFPDTWTRRARDTASKPGPVERLTPDTFLSGPPGADGKYFLPLDANTGPFEAVRYATSVLAEYAKREQDDAGVDGGWTWKSRI